MVLLAVTSVFWWRPVVFAAKLVFPGYVYEKADNRSSDEAATVDPGPSLTSVSAAPRPPGTAPTIALELVSELTNVTALADPPGPGPVFVTEQDGRLLELDLVTGETTPVMDLGDRISSGGERGLLGAAVDPAGERIYLHFTKRGGDVEIRSWPIDALSGEGTLHLAIGQPFENHNGGHLAFGPDGALWIGTGDGGGAGDRGNAAQSDDTLLGKMLRVVPDVDGGVKAPATNDTGDAFGGRSEIWGIGLRNPWRYSFDRDTGELWIGDVGQNAIEEISRVAPDAVDANFGWNVVEGDNDYSGEPDPAFVAPVITYEHSDGCSVAGGYVYRGSAVPELYGWYVFGDFCGGWVDAVPTDDAEAAPVRLLADVGTVRAFAEDEAGELYVLTDRGVERIVGS